MVIATIALMNALPNLTIILAIPFCKFVSFKALSKLVCIVKPIWKIHADQIVLHYAKLVMVDCVNRLHRQGDAKGQVGRLIMKAIRFVHTEVLRFSSAMGRPGEDHLVRHVLLPTFGLCKLALQKLRGLFDGQHLLFGLVWV